MPALRLYLDENVDQRIVPILRHHGCIVLTVQEAHTGEATDEAQLRFATEHQWILVTHNQIHFRRLHYQCAREGTTHGGIVLVPHTLPFSRLRARVLLMAAWLATVEDPRAQLFSWGEFQQRLISGYRPAESGCNEDDVRHALGRR